MPPVDIKKSWKEVNKERKAIRKNWKEKKLLKTLGLKKGFEGIDVNSEEINNTEFIEKLKNDVEQSEKTVKKKLRTISIAVPGSILENAQSVELKTYVAGQIARAACIYNIDEVIVFNDKGEGNDNKVKVLTEKNKNRACLQLARILQYLECPQYLRRHIFPIHNDLQYAGLLNPLDAPHHLRQQDEFPFREGIVSGVPIKKKHGSYVNVGLNKDVRVDKVLTPKLRVTVKLLQSKDGSKIQYGTVVPPSQPKLELGVYWGYTVRLADSLSEVFMNTPYKNGYDLTVGTSDKGFSVDKLFDNKEDNKQKDYKHCLIVFGGVDGLETALECDDKLSVDDVSLLFDMYVNTCPKQGSRTIRTEEAILISLAELRKLLFNDS
ncbi:28S rRNA (uridine-N(3))-methyltransferase [Lycorma delicatula]|uniref:28S rRNA (uridine-N(3))-methyltransferase n=1 Tax=Lycorma delicatula TaxID=130591 RepID=UPI003F513FB8